jgi:hypothetical protein
MVTSSFPHKYVPNKTAALSSIKQLLQFSPACLVVSGGTHYSDWQPWCLQFPRMQLHGHQGQHDQKGQDFLTKQHPIPLLLQYCMPHLDLQELLTLQNSVQKWKLVNNSATVKQRVLIGSSQVNESCSFILQRNLGE